ncbi:MAG: hypothetical protein Q9159_001198 [Coniocarpon cinnabarinum]
MSASDQSEGISALLASNKSWATQIAQNEPKYFENLSKGQSPRFLWIGCSDSRCPETTILGCKPGDVFVHRNIANVVPATDLSSLSAIEFSVVYLKVQHVVLCGHTGCGGVKGALDNKKLGKIDTWLQPLRQLRLRHAEELDKLSDVEKQQRLVELNVQQGVETLRQNPDIIDAVNSRGLQVHGVVFDLGSGELKSVDTSEENTATERRYAAFRTA